ncbi:hypothetical protein H4219_005154 [Mycoemilia scoparia]|uniref:Uncharacterized protein n=1 Tax=Mycoemilia scoparia TaxID=417184 RepID=A0A9W8DQL7_9FUNG|nr:hypothetical protein H4219_005154 [Mycoemilia scoparia]
MVTILDYLLFPDLDDWIQYCKSTYDRDISSQPKEVKKEFSDTLFSKVLSALATCRASIQTRVDSYESDYERFSKLESFDKRGYDKLVPTSPAVMQCRLIAFYAKVAVDIENNSNEKKFIFKNGQEFANFYSAVFKNTVFVASYATMCHFGLQLAVGLKWNAFNAAMENILNNPLLEKLEDYDLHQNILEKSISSVKSLVKLG